MLESTKNAYVVAKYKNRIKQLTSRLNSEVSFSVDFPDIEIFEEIRDTRLKLKEAKEVLEDILKWIKK